MPTSIMPLLMVEQQSVSQVRQRRPIGFRETLPVAVEVRRDLQLEFVLVASFLLTLRELRPEPIKTCVEIKILRHVRVVLHAIDATLARWRGDAGSSPLDRARSTASSPRNDLVKNYRVHPTLVDFYTDMNRATSSNKTWSLAAS